MTTKRAKETKQPRPAKGRALSAEQIDEALGRVSVSLGGTQFAAQRARDGDRETAVFMLEIAADLIGRGEALTGQLTPIRTYVVEALEALAKAGAIPDAKKRATAVMKALNFSPRGQNRFVDEARNIRIVRLVEALRESGWKLDISARDSAFHEAARIIAGQGDKITGAAVETVWNRRKAPVK